MTKLSILIPTVPAHQSQFNNLMRVLENQKVDGVEIHSLLTKASIHGGPSTGNKRQQLLQMATGQYIVFIDADDMVPGYYIEEMLNGCNSGADCFAINGNITTDGHSEVKWRISKDYQNVDVKENGTTVYLRHTNHITGVKREIALRAGFPNISNAEDKGYSDRLILHTEYKIERPMYHYRYSRFNKQYK